MRTQGQRQDFNWRPNDYSVQTRTRYDQEASHWLESIRGSIRSGSTSSTTSLTEMLGYLGLFISLFINLLTLLVLIFIDVINWVRKLFVKKLTPEEMYAHLPKKQEILTDEELETLWDDDDNIESINIRDFNEES